MLAVDHELIACRKDACLWPGTLTPPGGIRIAAIGVVRREDREFLSRQATQATRIASGNGTLFPVCVSIHTITTLPSE